MKTLGVSFGYHDSSASLVVDGKVVCASAEERFTRQKHDSHFPKFAIDYCLKSTGLKLGDIDQIVFHEDPYAKFSRILTSAVAGFPHTQREFVNATRSWLGRQLWALQTISMRLRVPIGKIRYLSHHFSHATHAFLGSGFEKAGILVVDAVGDWSCTALYFGSWEKGKPVIRRILEIPFPNSLGLVYSAVTAHLGFSPNDSECTTMALAAFGNPRFADELRKIVPDNDDGSYSVDASYFHFIDFYKGAVTDKFIKIFGPPRDARVDLPFSCFSRTEVSADAQRFADLAASVQLLVEERLIGLVKRLKAEVGVENLCLGGGVAMNCVATARVLSSNIFSNVYMPPDPGDGGTSIGTALFVNASEGNTSPKALGYLPDLGFSYDEKPILDVVDEIDPRRVAAFRERGTEGRAFAVKRETFADPKQANEKIAKLIGDGKIVGYFRGRYEFGPRALGHRSILTRPDDIEVALRLSQQVKRRALYRPYAISVTEEAAGRLLELPAVRMGLYRWMQHSATVAESMRPKVKAALHVDGTTRPQVVYRAENVEFHDLLVRLGELTGVQAVLNTSFNSSGYPLVRTPIDAFAMFMRTDMDALVINDTLIWKEPK
jgi:carbamoyltransferase